MGRDFRRFLRGMIKRGYSSADSYEPKQRQRKNVNLMARSSRLVEQAPYKGQVDGATPSGPTIHVAPTIFKSKMSILDKKLYNPFNNLIIDRNNYYIRWVSQIRLGVGNDILKNALKGIR